MVLSFSSAAEAMMFSVGWQAVEMTTSVERRGGQTPRGDTGKQGAGASTCVALQFLHDLLRLQVPDVHHVVLGARHDPLQDTGLASRTKNRPTTCRGGAYLPAGDGEIGKYAVLLVLMARVGFQALARSERNNLETFPVIE